MKIDTAMKLFDYHRLDNKRKISTPYDNYLLAAQKSAADSHKSTQKAEKESKEKADASKDRKIVNTVRPIYNTSTTNDINSKINQAKADKAYGD